MNGEFHTFTLSNGIRCIHKQVPGRVVHCALTINAGSRDEPAGQEGVAHFTEHALFKGTAHRQAHHINCRLENLGGELNAFTTKEETVVHATTLKEDFGAAAELIADVVFHSAFPAAKMGMEKTVILDEINSYKDSPQERIWDEFEDMIFAGSGLGHNILGTRTSVRRMGVEQVRGFVDQTYNTDQMVFSCIGDITQKAFRRTVDKHFGQAAPSPRAFTRIAPPACEQFEKTVKRNTHQAHCLIGVRAWDAFDPRRVALSLLVNILGGPAANSLLNIALREKNGLTYNIEANYTPFSDTGLASIYFSSEKDQVARCIELIEKQLSIIKTTRLTDRKLATAKKQFTGQLSISMEGNENYMLGVGKSYLLYDDVDSLEEIYKKIDAVTAAQVMDAANEIFTATSTLLYR